MNRVKYLNRKLELKAISDSRKLSRATKEIRQGVSFYEDELDDVFYASPEEVEYALGLSNNDVVTECCCGDFAECTHCVCTCLLF